MQHGNLRSTSAAFDPPAAIIPQSYPFVKWAGGKKQLLNELDARSPEHFDRYFEPFLGGGAFFFYLAYFKQLRSSTILSDLNAELINAYRVVKEHVEELINFLSFHQRNYTISGREYYYQLRAAIQPVNNVERAARFITLNKTCYNGLYRVNRNGVFNVPIGSYKNPRICDSKNLRNVSIALQSTKAQIRTCNYKEILAKARENDFVYLDPPYKPVSTTARFTSYTHDGFSDGDQQDLLEVFRALDRKGCYVLLSNSDTPLIRELYNEYDSNITEVKVLRSISCKGTRRTGHRELLIRNYDN